MDLCECLWCVLSFENHANREMTYTVKQQCFPFLFSRKNEEDKRKNNLLLYTKLDFCCLTSLTSLTDFSTVSWKKHWDSKDVPSQTRVCARVCASVRVFLRSAMPGILIIKLSKEMSAMAETPADSCSIVLWVWKMTNSLDDPHIHQPHCSHLSYVNAV